MKIDPETEISKIIDEESEIEQISNYIRKSVEEYAIIVEARNYRKAGEPWHIKHFIVNTDRTALMGSLDRRPSSRH